MSLAAGARLGPYEILAPLGRRRQLGAGTEVSVPRC
jgi:hypothetical protein